MFVSGRMLINIKDWNALRVLMNFLCIYFCEGRGALMHVDSVCMGTHSQPLLQNCLMDVYETWEGWRTHNPAHVLCVSAISIQGQIQGGANIGQGVSPSSKFFSSDRKATATNQMLSNDLEACGKNKFCYFLFHCEFKFLTRFDVFLEFVILSYFNAFSIDFYAEKCLINSYFCVISMFVSARMLLWKIWNALRFWIIFLCIHFGEGKGKGGMHLCIFIYW